MSLTGSQPAISTGDVRTEYRLAEELGSGTYGTVFKATRRRDGKSFAVKEIPKAQVRSYPSNSALRLHDDGCCVCCRRSRVELRESRQRGASAGLYRADGLGMAP
jgi:serine/threonine protein kinase